MNKESISENKIYQSKCYAIKDNQLWKIVLGTSHAPIGPRLSKKDPLPDWPILFDNEQEAVTYFKENYHLLDSCELHDLEDSPHAGLRAWFGKGKKGGAGGGGWDRYNTKGERIGKCGDRKASEGKPKCLSKARAAALRRKGGKAAIAAAVRRKRRKDKNPERRGKAINVSNKPRKKKK